MNWNNHIGNIFNVYAAADKIDLRDGLVAYRKYNELLTRIADDYDVDPRIVIGCFAALSPNNNYEGNIRDVYSVLNARRDHVAIDSVSVTTYRQNLNKAWLICHGEPPLNVLGGKKVRSFYQNIMDPDDDYTVTIDGHMFSVWMLKRFNMDDAQVGSGKKYDIIADDFRTVARALNRLPSQLQAVCWFTWKRVNLISVDKKTLQHNLVFVGDMGG